MANNTKKTTIAQLRAEADQKTLVGLMWQSFRSLFKITYVAGRVGEEYCYDHLDNMHKEQQKALD